jgi:hypothetical protein
MQASKKDDDVDDLLGSFGAPSAFSSRTTFDPLSGARFDPLKNTSFGLDAGRPETGGPSLGPDGPDGGPGDSKPGGGGGKPPPAAKVGPEATRPAPSKPAKPLSVSDAARLIRQSGVRDYVEHHNSGYNTPRRPGVRRGLPAPRADAVLAGGLESLGEEEAGGGSETPGRAAMPAAEDAGPGPFCSGPESHGLPCAFSSAVAVPSLSCCAATT